MTPKNESMWRVTEVDSSGQGAVVVHADFAQLPKTCPKCGSTHPPRRYGALDSTFRDAPFFGRQVVVTVNMQRFRCADCGQAFFQSLADMDPKRRMTAHCAAYVIEQVMARSSMKEVAVIVGIDEKGVRNLFHDRGMIFSVGDAPRDDRFVCECCLGIHPRSEMRLAPAKHFGRWQAGELQREANVCRECFDFATDPWRAGIARRI